MDEFEKVYNRLYTSSYRENLSGFEFARWEALDHFIVKVLKINDAKMILDYGAGSGLHVALWEKIFPGSSLYFCDISTVAKEKFQLKHPSYADSYSLVNDDHADFDNSSFDVVVSVEVMEHVERLNEYLRDIHRLLKPGGKFIWTTPCANELSIEQIFSFLTRKIEVTNEGFRRWRWEDPTHLRRLKSREIKAVLNECGFDEVQFRFRAHIFSFVCTYCPPRGLFTNLRNKLMTFDYSLFRRLPNGASMIGSARMVSN